MYTYVDFASVLPEALAILAYSAKVNFSADSRSRRGFRCVSAILSVLLAGAGLTLLGTSAASAAVPAGSAENGQASLTVTAHFSPSVQTGFVLDGRVTPKGASGDCATSKPMLSWRIGSRSGGMNTAGAGRVLTFLSFLDSPAAGDTVTIQIEARGGCTGHDGLYPNLTTSIDVNVDDLLRYFGDALHGTAYLGDVAATSETAYAPASGVRADLLDVAAGEGGSAVSTATTGADGKFLLLAPVDTQANLARHYKVRLTYPGGEVVYRDASALSAWTSSASTWSDATDVGGPASWDPGIEHTVMLSRAEQPSETAFRRLCNDTDSERIASFATAAVEWEEICKTAPTLYDAALRSDGSGAGLARIGMVWIPQANKSYAVTADSFDIETPTPDSVKLTLRDDDIYLVDQDLTVDVTVERLFEGSDTSWRIELRDSSTGDLVDVPFEFTGELDNANARTKWTRSTTAPAWVSDNGAKKLADQKEAILAHHVDAESYSLHTGLNEVEVEVDTGGRLDYTLAVLDYSGCVVGAARSAALAVAEALPAGFGEKREVLAGDACLSTWPTPDLGELRVGMPYDKTFRVESTALNWGNGGGGIVDITGLPEGLEFEPKDSAQNGVAPSYRIFGTPTRLGERFTVKVTAMDARFATDAVQVSGTVLPQKQTASIDLQYLGGDPYTTAIALVGGTGLKPGSEYAVSVDSPQQGIASGSIGADYALQDDAPLPAGLASGWHTIRLRGVFADGDPFTRELWFHLSAAGDIDQFSPTDPRPPADPDDPDDPDGTDDSVGSNDRDAGDEDRGGGGLPSTGADAGSDVLGGATAAILALLGLGLLTGRRIRRAAER